ncbi:MAG TPA: Fic family protein [Bacteroidales bacterium]|jgi:Fic family protein|nr:Fic family protein [Bacteroidales bacterium]
MKTIDELYNEWRSLQPMKKEYQQHLDEKFMLEFNYNSNHIEGNTLTYGQTKLLLMFDKTSGNASMRDYQEMKAHNVGLELMKREAIDKERPLTESFIRELNRVIQVENYRKVSNDGKSSYEIHVGVYKTRPNSVITATGQEFRYASPEETPALMKQLMEWYIDAEKQGELNPIELATLFHYRFIRIHPFEDGNGRVARLLVNYILLRHGYPMIIIKTEDKSAYLDALNLADIEVGSIPSEGANASLNAIHPFTEYIKKQVYYALQISIKAARGEKIEEKKDFEKALSLLKHKTKTVQEGEQNDTSENKLDVFNLFHRNFAKELIDALKPATEILNSLIIHYYMTKQVKTISSGNNIFFQLNVDEELSFDLLSEKEKDVLVNARSIMFQIALHDVKASYRIKDIFVLYDASVVFETEHYVFNKKVYRYGTFPSEDDCSDFILEIQSNLLNKLKNAEENNDRNDQHTS